MGGVGLMWSRGGDLGDVILFRELKWRRGGGWRCTYLF